MEAQRARAQPGPAQPGSAPAGDGPSGIESVGARARTLLSRRESELMSLRGTSFAEERRRAEEACAAARRSLTVRFEVPGGPLAPQADQVLGRVLRETMTNVFRHAPGARSFRFSVGEDRRGIAFTAVDDGGPVPPPRPGTGPTGLRDRLAEIGGELEADVTADGRFALTGHIPRTIATGSPEEAP
ncbi:hypothetical protein [Streptomyces sp. WAC06614]|uniref:hypothetical protein n=1 Tax=Streptomyces sp. WAC06614 TaxID=2487416 RepID=UPI000F7AB7B9|nr:hypothetical protein [Streptomyces sp. WAC06614]RSS74068.1 hypothetical protein EF918_24790 [Streptomyces sp. WAC06614]